MLFRKQKVVAMLLAGGQGSRLGVITKNLAKPAIPYGGKYRIIDFPLSNCVNSGIETIGVLTQYQPLILNEYIGNGKPWDLDNLDSGIQVLPPFRKCGKSDWYKGTANAVLQNMDYIERYHPDHVIILSGDHVYKMDYSKMIAFHIQKKASCSIATINVPKLEAKRFGILNIRPDCSICGFEEKPETPQSTTASMGIYVFDTNKLKEYLLKDEKTVESHNDFGKNIIPSMLNAGEKMFAYEFNGYWKDIGTIESLWESNMDLLSPNSEFNLSDDSWKIYSRNPVMPPHYISKDAIVQNSLISDGCTIYGQVTSSVLFPGVYVGERAIIKNSILMSNSVIKPNVNINYSIISENTIINEKSQIGCFPQKNKHPTKLEITVIAENLTIQDSSIVLPRSKSKSSEVTLFAR